MSHNPVILSVTDLSLSIKQCIEQVFEKVMVKGEVFDLKKASSGHIYFSLKDKTSILSAICWRGVSVATQQALVEGLEIICTGKISTYPGRSNYQMIVESAEPAGIGALLKLLKERKEKLEKEGLFDSSRKKQIPYLPKTIGIITSPTGAVIRDIIHRISDRFPCKLIVWPVAVQGDEAFVQIEQAIQGFNNIPDEGINLAGNYIPRPELLIVARGGGSLEDLWCFNEENVVRVTANSKIPIISAVGHETDTTLIDYASDLRAPTPTGAAEKAVPVRTELVNSLNLMTLRLDQAVTNLCVQYQERIVSLGRALPDLDSLVQVFEQRLDDFIERFKYSSMNVIQQKEQGIRLYSQLLESYSYKGILKRGFAFIMDRNKIISSSEEAKKTQKITVHFLDGIINAKVMDFVKNKKEKTDKEDEPSLF